MKAFLFAAGRGERMRPLTDTTPKPLLEAGGKPLIVWQLEALLRAGIDEVIINLSYLGAQIRAALGDGYQGLRIRYSEEGPTPLETAGGLRHALPLLGPEPFLTLNADVWCDVDLRALCRSPLDMAHLLMVGNPVHHPQGDFALRDGRMRLEGEPRLTFSGYALYRPALFQSLPPGVMPLRPVLQQAIAEDRVSGQVHAGRWFDVGTVERLAELDTRLIERQSVWPD